MSTFHALIFNWHRTSYKKIFSSSKIQGISIGTSSLKVSYYADDLTFFISSPQSFSAICEIIDIDTMIGIKSNIANLVKFSIQSLYNNEMFFERTSVVNEP